MSRFSPTRRDRILKNVYLSCKKHGKITAEATRARLENVGVVSHKAFMEAARRGLAEYEKENEND